MFHKNEVDYENFFFLHGISLLWCQTELESTHIFGNFLPILHFTFKRVNMTQIQENTFL